MTVQIMQNVIPVEAIHPHPRNFREHPESQLAQLEASYERFGQFRSIVVQVKAKNDYLLVAGHGIFDAMKRKGATQVRADVLPANLAPAEVEAIMIADNLLPQLANDDEVLLARLLQEQQEAGYDLRSLGTDEETLRQMLANMGDEAGGYSEGTGGDDFDTTPEEGPTRTHVGELWKLGEHRLGIFDCTRPESVKRLMDGEYATVCLTDPPYSVSYEDLEREPGRVTRKEQGDTYRDPIDAEALLCGFIHAMPADVLVMTYVFNKHFQELAKATRDLDLLYECVWVKHHFAYIMGRRYQPQHEPILIFRRKKAKGTFNVPNNQSTIFEYDKAASNPDHPTPKPVDLWIKLMEFHTNTDDVVYEPFSGSGTTFIAGQRLKRRVFGCEIEPKYADVIIRRWEAETGETAHLLERVEVPS